MRRRAVVGERAGRTAGLVGSVLVHGALILFFLVGVRPPAPTPPVYAVELVAAPRPLPQQRRAPEVVERPDVQQAPPEAEPEPAKPTPVAPTPKPAPAKPVAKPAPAKAPENTEPVPRAQQKPVEPLPDETPGTGSDIANVRTPGLEFPFPDYLRNIVAQVLRRWDRPTGPTALRAEVSFMILRDGTVRDIRFVTSSGNFSFDLAAQGAIEAAGNARAFGGLPEGYQADILPVSFFFSPRTPQ